MMLKTIWLLFYVAGVLSDHGNPCSGPGVNPDPSDISSFIICSEVGNSTSVTKTVRCPQNYIYSDNEHTCVEEKKSNSHVRFSRATPNICKSPGPMCASCDLMVVCVEMGGKLISYTNVSCAEANSNNICDAKVNGCKPPDADSNCRPKPSTASSFQCVQPGFFPDPTDCKKYHICDDSLMHYEDSCDVQYDPVSFACQENATCTEKASVSCSDNPRPRAVSSNAGYYSVCLPTLVRSPTGDVKVSYQTAVLQCPNSKQFNDATSTCEIACKKKSDRMADPEDCHSYYECQSTSGTTVTPVKKTCSPNLAFDITKKICVLESQVASCRRSVTTREEDVTPTTTPTTSTATTMSTSSSTNTNTAATTQQTTQTTKPTPQCAEGSNVIDNSNCYRYYQCLGGRLERRQCPSFTYFNVASKTCTFGFYCSYITLG